MHEDSGFTLVELLVSLAVGAVLVGIAMTGLGAARAAYSVRAARSAFGTLAAHARAQAVEIGRPVFFEYDSVGDSAWIRTDTATFEKMRFRESMGVDLVGVPASVCMSPRGIADPTCGTLNAPIALSFERSGRAVYATLLVYGQLLLNDGPPPP